MSEIERVISLLSNKKHVFLTGAAGTGKSFVTRAVIKHFQTKGVPILVTATTGTAARNIQGVTLNSALKIGVCSNVDDLMMFDASGIDFIVKGTGVDVNKATKLYYNGIRENLQRVSILVIDEVSMLSADSFNVVLHRMKQLNWHPTILFVGDFLQLPPVSGGFLFKNPFFRNVQKVVLTDVKRTTDREFIDVLHKLRVGKTTPTVNKFLQSKTVDELPDDVTKITSLRRDSDAINRMSLSRLSGDDVYLNGAFVGVGKNVTNEDKMKFLRESGIPTSIRVRIGARVMITVNDQNNRNIVNGTVGTVVDVPKTRFGDLTIKLDDGKLYKVRPNMYPSMKVKKGVSGDVLEPEFYYAQYPLQLAYSTTIHKSQGASIDKLGIDARNLFSDGQFYVAVSRATDPKNLHIKNLDTGSISADRSALRYYGVR